MKKLIFYIVIFILVSLVVNGQNIIVLDFEYDNGDITLKDKIIKPGHFPDRKLASREGYKIVEISDKYEVLYSANFEVPLTIFTDATTEYGEIKGNIIKLNKTEFSLVMPYFDNIKEIKIIDKNQNELTSINLSPKLSPSKTTALISSLFILGLICIIFSLLYFKKFKSKNK